MKWELIFSLPFLGLYLLSYIIGSMPFSVWVGKMFYNIDVREHGSFNAGATNTFRVLGKKAAIPVLCLDILKGLLASSLIYLFEVKYDFLQLSHETSSFVFVKIFCGVLAIVGHLLPVFAQFRGGKGVATLFGIIIGLNPEGALIGFGFFLFVFLLSNYISLGSMVGSLVYLLYSVFIDNEDRNAMLVFAFLQFAMIMFTHRRNILRIRAGTENKTYIKNKGALEK